MLPAGGGSMNAAFTDIVNFDRREPNSTRAVTLKDIPVAEGGTYRKGGATVSSGRSTAPTMPRRRASSRA